ncbi:MAG: oxidative damage protection protein [Caldilineaceae bacterium]|nr:oxidative damage protection protein [Caldilineaceae bacterium]MDE0337935.1 oxidative damage protection protein [Caldilineaceae bacterium]
MARLVQCAKIGQELPGMASPPYPGDLGQRIYERISQAGWDMWMQYSVVLINHYGLSLGDPQSREFLMQQTEEFFFGVGAQMPEGWTPEGTPGAGKGVPAGKGAPRK